jgi:hypothetical protein
MHIGWPQGIYLVLCLIGAAIQGAQHGKMLKRDAYASIGAWMFITLPLLWWGGFFSAP